MYHSYFALREEPFGVSPDGRFFVQTAQHREALATLLYAIQQRRGFALLVGRAGVGKTSVLVRLVELLEGKADVAYLPHPFFDRTNVLESILVSLGVDATTSPAHNHRLFYEYVMKTRRAGKTCVVVFDEAQDLNRETLEAIRMLSNFETPTEKLVQIVLAGQPRLADTLSQPDCEQIRQRVNVIARLTPMGSGEVLEYMARRLETAGASVSLFTPDALEAIGKGSGGIPRNVNTIGFNALSLAYALNHRRVERDDVGEVLGDLDLPSGQPLKLEDARRVPVTGPELFAAFGHTSPSLHPTIVDGAAVLLMAGLLFVQRF
jgi:general secretion pathway protein A